MDNKVFPIRFFSNMLLTRNQLARWCISKNEPLPAFWYPDNEKYPIDLTSDLVDERSADGRFSFITLYNDRAQPSVPDPVTEHSPITTVNENATKAAAARHAGVNAIKKRFIEFYTENQSDFPVKKAAAEYFFDKQLKKAEQLAFDNPESATRTLLTALRDHQKNSK